MEFCTVADLRKYLEGNRMSPERLGKEVGISNMTLRRLLDKPPQSKIPSRYCLALDHHAGKGSADSASPPAFSFADAGQFTSLLGDLEESGSKVERPENVEKDIESKMSEGGFEFLRHNVAVILKSLTLPSLSRRNRALALGALLYFLNPFDLIPDALVGVGYLDDIAVLSIVAGIIGGSKITAQKSYA